MQAFDVADFTGKAAQLPADLVEAVRRDLGISAEEYLANAEAARRAADVLDQLGEVVRSAWLEDQVLHVAVDDKADAAAVRATGAEVHVGDALTDALAAARAQDKVAYIDREKHQVVPVDIELRGEPGGGLRLLAQSDWRGGTGFAISDALMSYHCSTGFNGVDADGDPRVLTAGHCESGDDGLLTSTVRHLDVPEPIAGAAPSTSWSDYVAAELGQYTPGSFAFGSGRDVGLIDITNDDWNILPEVASWGGGDTATSEAASVPVYDSIDAVAGAPVCSSGVTSGWTCGQVLEAQATVPVSGQDVTGFVFDACVLPGDSGGAVLVGNYALGINSGSTWRGPTCAQGSPANGWDISLGYAVSSGDDNAESLYTDQWEMLVHVGTPVVALPADGSTVGPTPTLSGTVAAATGATVTVSIDDGPTLETRVAPSGRWKVSVDQTLPPGTYAYEVVASHTPATGDTTTTSGTATGSFDIAEVATLGVSWPQDGDTTSSARPTFEGTGHPGATITLTIDEEEQASATVGNSGAWSLRPEDALLAGRFDAVLTQRADDSSNSITVSDVGVAPGPPVITSPRPGDDVGPHHTFTGVGIVGATVSVKVSDTGDSRELTPATMGGTTAFQVQTDSQGIWEVELDAPLAAGTQSVVATQVVDGLTSEPSRPVSFEVAERELRTGGHIGGHEDDDLAETGSSSDILLLAGVFLLIVGAAAVAVERRRHRIAG